MLLECGAEVNTQNKNLETPLFAATSHGLLEIVQLLMSGDADPGIADRFQITLIELAKAKGFRDAEDAL